MRKIKQNYPCQKCGKQTRCIAIEDYDLGDSYFCKDCIFDSDPIGPNCYVNECNKPSRFRCACGDYLCKEHNNHAIMKTCYVFKGY